MQNKADLPKRLTIALCSVLILLAIFLKVGAAESVLNISMEPKENISRKIFAGLLAEQFQIKTSKSTKCFKDLKSPDKYSLYICGLKNKKAFSTIKTNAFEPEKKADWDFAIKSTCGLRKWTKNINFSSCLKFAKSNELLTGISLKKIKSKNSITYAQAQVLLKNAAKSISTQKEIKPSAPKIEEVTALQKEIPALKPLNAQFSPYPEEQIPATFFENIKLDKPLPNRFYRDEIYFVEGKLTDSNAEELFVFMCLDTNGCEQSINFMGDAEEDGKFSILVSFEKTGNFQIGIIPGESGQSRIKDISVVEDILEQTRGANAAFNLNAKYENEKTIFSWNGENALTRLIIFQNDKRKDYVFRQPVTSFLPNPLDFAEFKDGKIGWTVQQNSVLSPIQTIDATTADFRKINAEKISVESMPETMMEPGLFSFKGRALSPISKKAAITLPDGSVKEIIFAENDIPKNQNFKIEYDFAQKGTYIFEINDPEGEAIINAPVYVGGKIPLLPDYFALNKPALDTSPMNDLEQARKRLLKLINADRATYSLPAVALNEDLNFIAQNHSNDMVNRIFFGHVNPDGLSPDDRRKAAEFTAPIRENLGKSATLELAEKGLMRSPIHREAILDVKMTQVGLGIAKNDEGYFYITQNFSADPTLKTGIPDLEKNMITIVNSVRSEHNLTQLIKDETFQNVARIWSEKMSNEGFFKTIDKEGGSIVAMLRAQGVDSSLQIYIIQASDKEHMEKSLLKQDAVSDAEISKTGIGIYMNNVGELFLTAVYAP